MRAEPAAPKRHRLQALYLLASGQATSRGALAALLAVHRHTIGAWLRQYEAGGLSGLLTIKTAPGKRSALTPAVLAHLQQRLAQQGGLHPMPDTFNYPALIERDEDGRFVVTFPDFGRGATDGATLEEALAEARDLLCELIATTIREGQALPAPSRPSKRRPLVIPPLQIALKAAFYEAYRQANISQRRLARDLDVGENEVRRMLNPDHATKAGTIDAVLRRLGARISLTVDKAA